MLHLQNSDWDKLCSNSLIPSASHARIWLAPMFEHFNGNPAKLILAGNRPLLALAALEKQTLPGGFSLPIAQTWDTGFLFSGTPLVDQSDPQNALLQVLNDARTQLGAKVVRLKKVQMDAVFDTALNQLSQHTLAGHIRFNLHDRAALLCTKPYEAWFSENFSKKRRKEYRRLVNRLSETGNLQSTALRPQESVDQWVKDFLQLESAGWKGRSGTAIACNKERSAYLQEVFPTMTQNGSLLFWKITLDDKPIAMMFGFVEQDQVWLGKMAFDETLAQFSPGVLIILDATKDLLGRDDIKIADSSADPDHPMINNIWRDRITIADYFIATPGTSSTEFKMLVAMEKTRLKARSLAKSTIGYLQKGLK